MVIWSLVDVTKKMQLLVLKWKEFMWMVILWQRMKWRWWSCFNDSSFRITNQTTVRSRGYLCGASSLLKTKNGTEKDENLCHWVFCVSCVMHMLYVCRVKCYVLCCMSLMSAWSLNLCHYHYVRQTFSSCMQGIYYQKAFQPKNKRNRETFLTTKMEPLTVQRNVVCSLRPHLHHLPLWAEKRGEEIIIKHN